MDSIFPATKEDLQYVQMDIKHVQAVQTNHADRLLRLERRQADDAALKSVWGTGSPFPGILSGTPMQGPLPNPSNDVFDDFDDEHGHNLLNSLQLEAEEEPVRRGASRANSVRFDVSALQGSNWAQGNRLSGDFGPTRPSSGFGGHPIERSLSHKSDGRHSSAGHSVHSMHSAPSGRTSSLGLDTNFMIGGQHDEDSPLDVPEPPPGLFILGSVPSIIRCWLTTNFSHNSLLYSAVCTGSQRSVLDYSLVKELGLSDQVHRHRNGRNTIKLPVYLPEAIITQPSSRSNSPAPHLPTLTSEFEIFGFNQRSTGPKNRGIRVFLGSDTLRAHNADVLFSQNIMTLYGDDRNKLSVPFVRPEDETIFKDLCTANIPPEKLELKATATPFTPTEGKSKSDTTPNSATSSITKSGNEDDHKIPPLSLAERNAQPEDQLLSPITPKSTSDAPTHDQPKHRPHLPNGHISDTDKQAPTDIPSPKLPPSEPPTSAPSSRRTSSVGIWGSWRQNPTSTNPADPIDSTSGYQKAPRHRTMKVLKPSKSVSANTSSSISTSSNSNSTPTAPLRSTSKNRTGTGTGATYEPAPPRPSGEIRRKSGIENVPLRWESKKTPAAVEEQKGTGVGNATGTGTGGTRSIARSSNPIGGASAFAWMNSGKPKASAGAE